MSINPDYDRLAQELDQHEPLIHVTITSTHPDGRVVTMDLEDAAVTHLRVTDLVGENEDRDEINEVRVVSRRGHIWYGRGDR